MTLLMTTGSLTIAAGAVIFLVITLILVGALLAAKAKLVPSGNVDLKVNGEKDIETPIGSTLLAGLQSGGIFLSSACGGGGKCGQCRAQVIDGGGEILPTEKGFFSRKQVKDHWRVASAVHRYWKEAGKSCRQKRAFSLVNRLRNTGVWHVSAK